MKLSILIGAGASYGCGYTNISKRPPLGSQLYDELVKKYPHSWGKYVPKDLIHIFKSDIELGMARMWESQPKYFSRLLIDMAVFFTLFDPPDEKNNLYTTLINIIVSVGLLPKCGFISLNYECIFEIAASRAGIKITMNSNSPAPGNLLMWKPHGSCNFIPTAQVYNLTLQLTGSGQRYYEGDVEVLQLPKVRDLYLSDTPYAIPPAMSLYAPGKATLSAEQYIRKIRESMASWVNDSDYIITIGAKPNLADKHIWGPILSSKAMVWYVGGKDENMQQLKKRLGNNRFEFISEKFKDAINILNVHIKSLHRVKQ